MTAPPDAFLQLLDKAKVVVCVGSGGVGKTTTAAAVAIAAARRGRRAAVLTIDPARRLAQALGIDGLGNTAKALPADLVAPGSVDAMMLETGEAFDALIRRLVPDEERQERLLQNRLYQIIARQLGGTHEYMAVDKLFELSTSDAYDVVVVDTPPSVNALDFLEAPRRISSFFSDRIQRFFIRRADEQKRGFFQKIKDRAGDMALSLLGKALGESFIEDVQDFATAFQGLFEAFRERGLAIEKLLAHGETHFLVITGADPARVNEALTFAEMLRKHRITPKAFIANRVHQVSSETAAQIDGATIAPQLPPGKDAEALAAILMLAHRRRAALARRDREGLVQLQQVAGKEKLLVVPELDDEVQDRGAVEHLLRSLTPTTAADAR